MRLFIGALKLNYFQHSSKMKTSEIKHFAHNSRLTKLKLESSLAGPEVGQFFIREDAEKANHACAVLRQLSTDQKSSVRDAAHQCQQLMNKLKMLLDHHYLMESKQIKFRIVKSAKKVDRVETVCQDDIEFFEIKNSQLKQQLENRSQVIAGKQNKICLQKQLQRPSTLVSNSKIKLNKINEKTGEILANISEVKSENDQFLMKDMKNRNRKLPITGDQKFQELACYKDRIQALQEENSKLRGMLLQIGGNTKQEFKIEFKVSLKCIETQKNSIDENAEAPTKANSMQINKDSDSIQKNRKEKSIQYFEGVVSHLQMMVVSQAKQIENIRTKVVMNQNRQFRNLGRKRSQ